MRCICSRFEACIHVTEESVQTFPSEYCLFSNPLRRRYILLLLFGWLNGRPFWISQGNQGSSSVSNNERNLANLVNIYFLVNHDSGFSHTISYTSYFSPPDIVQQNLDKISPVPSQTFFYNQQLITITTPI